MDKGVFIGLYHEDNQFPLSFVEQVDTLSNNVVIFGESGSGQKFAIIHSALLDSYKQD